MTPIQKQQKKLRNGGFGDRWGDRSILLGDSTNPNGHPLGQ